MSTVILLIGETGNGKSSLGNLINNDNSFVVSNDFRSCTKETILKTARGDPSIAVIDTPGLQDYSGTDKEHYDQMIRIIKSVGKINMILIVLNYQQCRLTSSIQYMIKFLCNVFPTNFSHHVGIVFTHFNLQREIEEDMDERDNFTEKYVPEIMKIISETTREPLFRAPPVFFLDSRNNLPLAKKDQHTQSEIARIIANAKMKNPIQNINEEASYDNPYQSKLRNVNTLQRGRNSNMDNNSRNDSYDFSPLFNLATSFLNILAKSKDNSSDDNLINRNRSNYPPSPPHPSLLNNSRRNQFNSPSNSPYSQVPYFGPVHGPLFGPSSPPY
jgi:GTPase Era involved in 16S rRNA processing